MDIKSAINKFTVYQYMIIFLLILSLVSAFFYGFGINALFPVLIAVITTVSLDFAINYFKTKSSQMRVSGDISERKRAFACHTNSLTTAEFPQSALISGLFIGGLLTQGLQWYVYVLAGIIAIASKHLIRFQQKHIFNPANFGILFVSFIFPSTFNSWWISSPILLVIIFGLFILWRQKRFDLGLSFLIAYYIIHLFIEVPQGMMQHHSYMMAYHGVYLSVIEGSVLYFFAMFMLIEPKTNPAARKQRIFYGILVALMYVGIEIYNPKFGLPFVLAIANMFVPLLNRFSFEFRKISK